MIMTFIDKQDDDLLRYLVSAMKRHDDAEWETLQRVVYKQDEVMTTWDTSPNTTLEKKFSVFWELIRPFSETVVLRLKNLNALDYSQMKRELQLGCLKGLREFDVQGKASVSGWLRNAWRFQDELIPRRKKPQNKRAPSTIKNKNGVETHLVEILPDKKFEPHRNMEIEERLGPIRKAFKQKMTSYPWEAVIAVWLDDPTCLDDPQAYPDCPQRARQHIIRALAEEIPSEYSVPAFIPRTNVFFRRHLWKKLSETVPIPTHTT